MSFYKKMIALCQKKGVSRSKMADELGLSRSTAAAWEANKSAPQFKTAKKIADYFGVPVDYLLNDSEPIRDFEEKAVKIPVFASVAAGIPIEAIEDIVDYEEIDAETAKHGEHFALKIKGNSMEPRICNGDVVIVRQQPSVDSGDIAIAIINGLDATCKKIIKKKDGIELVSLNPSYSPMFYSNAQIEELPVKILGKVVELRGKF